MSNYEMLKFNYLSKISSKKKADRYREQNGDFQRGLNGGWAKWVQPVKTYKLPIRKQIKSWRCNVQCGNYS